MNLIILAIFLLVVSGADVCKTDSDCYELNSCVDGFCAHKDIFPMADIEYGGSIIMIFIAIMSNSGGVGGSPIAISLMLLMFRFEPHACVGMAQVFVFSGTSVATLLKFRDRHPTRDRPLIYYDVLMQIISPLLLGVTIGVLVNPAFPGWLILGLLTLLVFFLFSGVLKKAIKLYKKEKLESLEVVPTQDIQVETKNNENLAKKSEEADKDKTHSKGSSDQFINGSVDEKAPGTSDRSENIPEDNKKISEISDVVLLRKITTIYDNEKKMIALKPLIFFILLAAISIIMPMLRGSDKSSSIVGIQSCSVGYFMISISYCIFMLVMNLMVSIHLIRKTEICEQTNYNFDEGDIRWDRKKCLLVSLVGIFAGIMVGLLGLGGGNIVGPFLLFLGVRPELATISSSFVIFISSGTASAQFFISKTIDIEYSALFFVLSCVGSLIGILCLRKYAVRKKRVSILIFCLAFILFGSLVIIPTAGIMNALKQDEQGTLRLSFNSIC